MGGRESNNMQSDRPESGGADKDNQHENSGLLAREKKKFAEEEVEKHGEAPAQKTGNHNAFSIGSEPNHAPKGKKK
jgi:hypothetical protein